MEVAGGGILRAGGGAHLGRASLPFRVSTLARLVTSHLPSTLPPRQRQHSDPLPPPRPSRFAYCSSSRHPPTIEQIRRLPAGPNPNPKTMRGGQEQRKQVGRKGRVRVELIDPNGKANEYRLASGSRERRSVLISLCWWN